MKKDGFYNRVVKRVLDIVCASLVILLFGWLFLILALIVRVKMGTPVIFCQERPGRIDPETGREKVFKLYKFRSMTDARDENGNLLPDEARLPRFGRLLRATSLDELPEVWNILKGDMSIVGPRPLLVRYLELYREHEHYRHNVRPGVTGLAQVNGRNHASWQERFDMDAEYVDKVSFAEDVKILFLTVKKVLSHEGVEFEKNYQTMEEYISEQYGGKA